MPDDDEALADADPPFTTEELAEADRPLTPAELIELEEIRDTLRAVRNLCSAEMPSGQRDT